MTQIATPLLTGDSRDFPTGRVTIAVTRLVADVYRVVVLQHGGTAIDCWTRTFDASAGDLPVGMSSKRAAWEYMQCIAADFGADLETPAAIAARVRAERVEVLAPVMPIRLDDLNHQLAA